jgi:hypothetical protein
LVFFTFFFLKYSKLKIGIFILQNIFFAFSHSFKYQKFFAAKTLTQMSHLFSVAELGPIVFFYRWITWPDVLLGCFLVLTWCCFSFDWLNSSLLQICPFVSWLRPSSCLLCLSTTGFCFIILQRRSRSVHSWNGIIFAYDALVVVLLLLVWLVMSSTFFFFFLYIIGILFKISCCYTFILLHCSGR